MTKIQNIKQENFKKKVSETLRFVPIKDSPKGVSEGVLRDLRKGIGKMTGLLKCEMLVNKKSIIANLPPGG
ncbi:MAG: hypothetical protein KAW56_16360 [Candidatus Marinimicrobia bacterium]|nr:hypothetical protein [Candidatus Neomarinimicrobiota bacterium]